MNFLHRALFQLCWGTTVLSSGCVLPTLQVAEEAETGDVCGLDVTRPLDCRTCLQAACCAQAADCSEDEACDADMSKPIDPTQHYSTAFDPMLACMQSECDDECDVSYGCVDNYAMPPTEAPIDLNVRVRHFAQPNEPAAGADVTVRACSSLTGCYSGTLTEGVTDENGEMTLTLESAQDLLFSFEGGSYDDGAYLPGLMRWSEPVYRLPDPETGERLLTYLSITDSGLRQLGMQVGVDPSALLDGDAVGFVVLQAQNCLPARYLNRGGFPRAEASNLVFEADRDTTFYYAGPGGLADPTATATSAEGIAGAFEASVGQNLVVTARIGDGEDGPVFAHTTVPVVAGTVSYLQLLPRALR